MYTGAGHIKHSSHFHRTYIRIWRHKKTSKEDGFQRVIDAVNVPKWSNVIEHRYGAYEEVLYTGGDTVWEEGHVDLPESIPGWRNCQLEMLEQQKQKASMVEYS